MPPIEEIVAQVLGMPVEEVTDDTGPNTAKNWDSMRHIELVLTLETTFGVKFSPSEIMLISSIGSARELLQQKGAAI